MIKDKHFTRKTKKNYFERFFFQEGLDCLYLHLTNGEISMMRHRLYKDETEEDIVFEISVKETPQVFKTEVDALLNRRKKQK